jgi:hypothetical protein
MKFKALLSIVALIFFAYLPQSFASEIWYYQCQFNGVYYGWNQGPGVFQWTYVVQKYIDATQIDVVGICTKYSSFTIYCANAQDSDKSLPCNIDVLGKFVIAK